MDSKPFSAICSTLASRAALPSGASVVRATPALALAGLAVVVFSWVCPHDAVPPVFAAGLLPGFGLLLLARRRARGKHTAERTLGAYRLDEKIGEGGMGVVYKASHALLQRPAAVKLLSPERAGERDRKRFEREVQLTSKLTHPNTISIYDFGRTPAGTFYYAMEYVDGCDLQTLVEQHGPQDPARVAHLLAQLTGALLEAHRVGLIHRDVKPANVMLCERGGIADVVKVLDFGLIKELDRTDAADGDEHCVVGTPLYLAPEALVSPESVDARSDLYAVGAVGYFLLTGTTPFTGASLLEVCEQHLHSTPEAPSSRLGAPIPHELEALILACLAKDPNDRPQSAAAVQSALVELAARWTPTNAAAWWTGRESAVSGSGLRAVSQAHQPVYALTTQLAA